MTRVIGLNSGSSFDGVDVVLVEIDNGPDGYPARPKFIMGSSYDWPQAVAEIVLAVRVLLKVLRERRAGTSKI